MTNLLHLFCPIFWLYTNETFFPMAVDEYIKACRVRVLDNDTMVSGKLTSVRHLLNVQSEYPNITLELEVLDKTIMYGNKELHKAPIYGHRYEHNGLTYLQYIHTYGFNGAQWPFSGLGSHWFDREHVTLELDGTNVTRIFFSRHNGGVWKNASECVIENERLQVFVAWNSHASYEWPGYKCRFYGFGSDLCNHGKMWDPQYNIIRLYDSKDKRQEDRNKWMQWKFNFGEKHVGPFNTMRWWSSPDESGSYGRPTSYLCS